jgi:hypothetical protein
MEMMVVLAVLGSMMGVSLALPMMLQKAAVGVKR